jgi:hypothetical protein
MIYILIVILMFLLISGEIAYEREQREEETAIEVLRMIEGMQERRLKGIRDETL